MEVNGVIITPQNGNAGTHNISVSVTNANEGIDKSVEINAICGDKIDTLTVIREGKRQLYRTKNGDVLYVANGGRYGVLKKR